MVRGKGKRQREILSVTERDNLLDQRRELEDILKERENYGSGTPAEQIDVAKIKHQIAMINRAIEDRTPATPRGANKDRLLKEVEELAEKIKEGMPTRYEMDQPHKNPGSVRKHMTWESRNRGNIERFRELQRILNPGMEISIETFRKEK